MCLTALEHLGEVTTADAVSLLSWRVIVLTVIRGREIAPPRLSRDKEYLSNWEFPKNFELWSGLSSVSLFESRRPVKIVPTQPNNVSVTLLQVERRSAEIIKPPYLHKTWGAKALRFSGKSFGAELNYPTIGVPIV